MFKGISKKRILITLLCIVLFTAAAILIAILTPVSIPADTGGMIATYTRNKPNVRLSVSLITPDGTSIYVYKHDGKQISDTDTVYEIANITKTFTGALTARAVLDGRLSMDAYVNEILPIPSTGYIPTIGELATQTSAYADFKPAKVGKGTYPYSGINDFDILMAMTEFEPSSPGPYMYSNSDFGAALLGTVIGDIYSSNFITVLNDFIHMDLGLRNTYVATGSDKPRYGNKWVVSDAYIAAIGLSSTIDDITAYVKMILNQSIDYFAVAATPLKEINEDTESGYMWIISRKTGIASCYGGTSHYSSAILMDVSTGKGVVVLSNYSDDKYGSVYSIANAFMTKING